MKNIRAWHLVFILAVMAASPAAAEPPVECFTPGGDCTGLIVHQIAVAERSVLVQAYNFTSQPITDALIAARRRGLEVRVILDKAGVCYSHGVIAPDCQKTDSDRAGQLLQAGVTILIDAAHAIAHNKVIVIDASSVITGSFNFTKAAQERNAENLILLRDRDVATRYAANWWFHASHSVPYLSPLNSRP